ncbi:winged helix-turn-helix domain-containing protein [Hydrogenobacter hydrogenophilus]|nr:winged helix-turn-helix domain-containing protein [Hydrogenobacter hydrogenophilus]
MGIIEVLISRLRKKIDPHGRYIKTVKGLGYILKI